MAGNSKKVFFFYGFPNTKENNWKVSMESHICYFLQVLSVLWALSPLISTKKISNVISTKKISNENFQRETLS